MSIGENLKNKKIICGVFLLVVVGVSIFIWNNYQIQVQERPIKPIKLPPQISGKCGIEQCHGLDITCGPNVPEMCDTMYQVADDCRQYARCEKVDGKCQLVKEPEFDQCRLCIERCAKVFKDDVLTASQCESECLEIQSYIACGCGCCSSVEPEERCLYHSRGDDLQAIIEADKETAQNPDCPMMGCSLPLKYIYCD
jgi:hypothetical protein